jgi:hypothetical protein
LGSKIKDLRKALDASSGLSLFVYGRCTISDDGTGADILGNPVEMTGQTRLTPEAMRVISS